MKEAKEEEGILEKPVAAALSSAEVTAGGSSLKETENSKKPSDPDRRAHWVPDEESVRCNLCHFQFTVTRWKHHCRICGQVFCRECSATRMRIPDMGYVEKVRVCDECALVRASSHSQSLQESLQVKEQINAHLKQALGERTTMVDRFRTFLLEVESEAAASTDVSATPSTGHSDDSFDSLMEQSEAGLRRLVDQMNAASKESEFLRSEIGQMRDEANRKELCVSDLTERIRQSAQMQLALQQADNERDELRRIVEEQKRLLADHNQQLNGYRMRCTALETEQKKLRAGITSATSTNISTSSQLSTPLLAAAAPLLLSSSDYHRQQQQHQQQQQHRQQQQQQQRGVVGGSSNLHHHHQRNGMSLWSYMYDSLCSVWGRRRVTSSDSSGGGGVSGSSGGWEEDHGDDNFAVAYTVADGLDESVSQQPLSRPWWCCCRRRRRRYYEPPPRHEL
eukprot:GHVS01013131.1.p1 GENE.GHVS01013131.1~~GHVS01013131.1.p1  ORF type:complete len:451 (+),score=107.19 GHVS01013131.1:193-1545(+)